MNKRNQCQMILDYLDKKHKVTVRDINMKLYINGATARISDLRKDGYNIQGIMVKQGKQRFKVYFRGPDAYNNFIDPILKDMSISSKEFI